MKRFDYIIPKDLKEAISCVKGLGERAKYIAGGTDILVRLKQRAVDLDCLVSLRRLPELHGISLNSQGIVIGGATPIRHLLGSEIIQRHVPVLIEALRVLANPQVRNVASLSGNICNAAPSADSVPPLMALETTLHLEGDRGRRTVALEDFFLGPGQTQRQNEEVLTQISIKLPSKDQRFAFEKIGRVSQDIAIVNGAICLSMEKGEIRDVKIVLGAVAPTPLRLVRLEERLRGERLSSTLIHEIQKMAEREVRPISDVRASEEYRRHISGIVVKRLIERAAGFTE